MQVSRATKGIYFSSHSQYRPTFFLNWRRAFSWSSVHLCPRSESHAKPLRPTTLDPQALPVDHRTLSTSLDLFSTTRYSPGTPLFHPDGSHVFLKLQAFLRAQYSAFGFKEVISPTIYKQSLWEMSGHWGNYKDDMFEVNGRRAEGEDQVSEDEKYGLKPMNCPGHCLLYKTKARGYRELPLRFADFSPLHRNEVSGSLSGLTRVRRFHQDDGHIFCRPSQVGEEIQRTLQFIGLVYDVFGLGPYKLVLSTRPKEHYVGEVEEWVRAEKQLREVLGRNGREWVLNEGDGAFYGPKIDIVLKDSDGKEHQTATIQLDFQLPRRFDLCYRAPAPELEAEGTTTDDPGLLATTGDVTPVLIHRAILGSLERFMALLIEHFKGRWPFWLSPKQVLLLAVDENDETTKFVEKVANNLRGFPEHVRERLQPIMGSRRFEVEVDARAKSLSRRIAEAKKAHFNLIGVIGPQEVGSGRVILDLTGQPNLEKVLNMCEELTGKTQSKPRAIDLSVDELRILMERMCEEYL